MLRTDQIEQLVDLKMDGHRNELLAKLDTKPSVAAMIINSVVVLSVFLAILAYAADRFSGGMSATGALAQQAVERERRDAELNAKIDKLANEIAASRAAEKDKAP